MEWNASWRDPLTTYLAPFAALIGDQRTREPLKKRFAASSEQAV